MIFKFFKLLCLWFSNIPVLARDVANPAANKSSLRAANQTRFLLVMNWSPERTTLWFPKELLSGSRRNYSLVPIGRTLLDSSEFFNFTQVRLSTRFEVSDITVVFNFFQHLFL